MLNSKKFFNKRTITLLIASVLILTALIILTATGAVHKSLDCPDCSANEVGIYCETCGDTGELQTTSPFTCPDCSGRGQTDIGTAYEAVCETCGGEGLLSTIACSDCCATCEGSHAVEGYIWALLPPIIAIGLALITK